jgi:hypothetical protein
MPFPVGLDTDDKKGTITHKLLKYFATTKPSIPDATPSSGNIFTISSPKLISCSCPGLRSKQPVDFVS